MMTPFEEQLKDALKVAGYLLPESLEELEAFDKNIEEKNPLYPFPDHLMDSAAILLKGFSTPEPLIEDTTEGIQEDFYAMAARFGNHLPDHIKERMKRDRDNARDKEE